MRRTSRTAIAMALGTFVALGAACTDAGSPFFIVHNSVPEPGCSVGSGAGDFIPRGAIDANADAGYLLTPVAQNTAEEGESASIHIVFVEGADIELTIQSGFEGALGVDRLAEVNEIDGNTFTSNEPGYLVVTFPNTGEPGASFKYEYVQKLPCYAKVDPNAGGVQNELVVEILGPDGAIHHYPRDEP